MRSINHNDLSALPDVSPQALHKYFLSLGWIDHTPPSLNSLFIMRKLINNSHEEILIPINHEYADFKQRITEAIYSLSHLEQIESNEILNVISTH